MRKFYLAQLVGTMIGFALAALSLVSHDGRAATESKPVGLTICQVFPDKVCANAMRVAWCESRFQTDARNGQYRGIFQMGAWERKKFGHGSTALEQARAAYRYWKISGWHPWACRTAIQ
jgi:hypothetical protein